MKPSAYYERLADVMEELVKFTLMVRARSDYLKSRYSEHAEAVPELAATLATAAMSHEANPDETEDELE